MRTSSRHASLMYRYLWAITGSAVGASIGGLPGLVLWNVLFLAALRLLKPWLGTTAPSPTRWPAFAYYEARV